MTERKEEIVVKNPWIIFDFDGVLGRYPGYFSPGHNQLSELARKLGEFVKRGYKLGLLTNRSVVELQPLASFLGLSGWVVGENGAVALNIEDPRFPLVINESFRVYCEQVRAELLRRLEDSRLVALPDYQGSEFPFRLHPVNFFVKVVLLPKEGLEGEDLKSEVEKLKVRIGNDLLRAVSIKVGKGIDIDPKDLSKAEGMRWFLELNGVDPSRTIFIADAQRDIPAAEILMSRGGYFGIVGNASEEVLNFAREREDIIIANSDTQYHGSVVQILEQLEQQVFNN